MRAVKPVPLQLILATTLVAAGFLVSTDLHAIAATDKEARGQPNRDYVIKQEVHGKPSVQLHEKFTIPVKGGASGVAWSPDGSILAVASETTLATYSSSGHYLSGFNSHSLRSSSSDIAFVNGAKEILFPVSDESQKDAALDVRDLETGHIVATLFGNPVLEEFSVSPDRKRVAIARYLGDKAITYNAQTWKPLSETVVSYPQSGIDSLAFFPDSTLLAIGIGNSGVPGDKHVALVDSTSGKTLREFTLRDPDIDDGGVFGLAVSPKSDYLLVGMSNQKVRILRLRDGKQVAVLTDPGTGVTRGQALWDPKGRFVAFVDGISLIIWQPQIRGENFIRFRFSSPPKTFFSFVAEKIVTMDLSSSFYLSLAITQDGNALAVTHGDSVTVFNIDQPS